MSTLAIPRLRIRIRRRRRPPRFTRSQKVVLAVLTFSMIGLGCEFVATPNVGAVIGAAGCASSIQGTVRQAKGDLFGALRAELLGLALVLTACAVSFLP